MKNLLVVCETIKYELQKVQKDIEYTGDIIWINSNLHNDPDLLRSELQKVINNNIDYKNVLFGYGNCGNALVGLKAVNSRLIIPKTADCISMLLHNHNNTNDIRKDTYFFTRGWIEGEKSLVAEYEHCVSRYGEKKSKIIFNDMLKHYKNLMFIDLDAYDIDEYVNISRDLAEKVNLILTIEKGDLTLIEKLLSQIWDDDFCIIEKGDEVKLEHFGYNIDNEKT